MGRAFSGSLVVGRDSGKCGSGDALNTGDVGRDDAPERGGVPGSETCQYTL